MKKLLTGLLLGCGLMFLILWAFGFRKHTEEWSPAERRQVIKGGDSFYALVCYSCSDILFFDSDGNRVSGWGMTYEAEFALIYRFYELFPDDAEVQALKI